MHESLTNQLAITAWDMMMSQLVTRGGDEVKRESIRELAALIRMASSNELLATARAVTRRWKDRDTDRLHRTIFNDLLSLLGAATMCVDDLETENGAPASATVATSQKALAPLVGRTVWEVERGLILETLSQLGGNRTHAAAVLGISLRTLRNKLHQYAREGAAIPLPLVVGAGLGRRHHAD